MAQDPSGILEMFPREDLEIFGAFSLVITALLWFLGYVILQARSYKRMYENEVGYNKELSQAEAERSRLALETMEAVRKTMEKQVEKSAQDREAFLKIVNQKANENKSDSKD